MKIVRRLIGAFWSALMLTSILGTIAAWAAKQRIVPVTEPEADEIRLAAIFEPMLFQSAATGFRGGTVDCWYGGGVVDLRDAVLDPAGARLVVRAVFGGGQIVIPEDWRITSEVFGIGGLRDARPDIARPADAPHLLIEGLAIFGGFAVQSDLTADEVRGLEEAVELLNRKRHRASGSTPRVELAV